MTKTRHSNSGTGRMAFVLAAMAMALGAALTASAQDNAVSDAPAERILIHAGTSRVITSPWPVVRVSITNPSIADVEVLTPRQILLSGHQLGSTDLILWNEQDEISHTRIRVTADLDYINDELGRLFPTSDLNAMQTRDVVHITGHLRRAEDAARLQAAMEAFGVSYLDSSTVAGVHQVLIHVRVAEVARESVRSLGIDTFLTVRTDNLSVPDGSDTQATWALGPTGFGSFSLLSPHVDFAALVEALVSNSYARVLAEPTLVAMSGERASFLAGGEFPVPVVQGGGASAAGATSITIEYREFGVRLEFEPFVQGDNTIRLYVAPEVSELSDVGAVEIEGFRIPATLTRRAETTVELRSGQTFAMAGLLNQTITARSSRTPVLGDLPVLGPLFRSVRYQRGETELLVLVTATLVEPVSRARHLVPGDLHITPNDWDLFINGRLEGPTPVLAGPEAEWMREMGLHRLKGPGAWAVHGQPAALPRGVRRVPKPEEVEVETEGGDTNRPERDGG